ncbi:reticuline oxidase-like [Triticum dicoccoides]|uniref:reticuline oxidase-like n=1 Tax=Triticum dicoccoides TaxID=85692 RepID=UPI00188E0984|nr:reticuline oxidase-like [Triticum dicoccoides]
MRSISTTLQLVCLLLSLHRSPCSGAAATASNFSSCLVSNGVSNFSVPTSPGYAGLLHSSIFNLRFTLPNVAGPAAIVLPESRDDLRRAILCARARSLAIRVRSGGHSYEGLSYTTENHVPFVLVDLANLNRVRVEPGSATAWAAESGATLGELYYAVGRSSYSLALPAGSGSTTGLGGHVSGGGFGLLSRKFGLAADNVLDAAVITPDGRVLDRSSMGDDVFWAIRGGGGGSWGVVYAWKLRTAFTVGRTGPVELIAGLLHRWQYVGPNLPDEFYLSVYAPTGSTDGNVSISFTGQVLASKDHALSVLSQSFPELGLTERHLSEMSWVESTAKFAGLSTVEDLPNRRRQPKQYSKSKSDYVQAPIWRNDMAEIVRHLSTGPTGSIQLDPYGGAMARVRSAETPFPHRAGNLYSIQYGVSWNRSEVARAEEFIGWLRSFYKFMAPYVSKDPRAAYVNYLDLDLGVNNWTQAAGGSSAQAVARARSSWGEAYFGGNFDRLVVIPKWCFGKNDGWVILVDKWLGDNAEFAAKSSKNRANRKNRNHWGFKAMKEDKLKRPLSDMELWKLARARSDRKECESEYYGKTEEHLETYKEFEKLHLPGPDAPHAYKAFVELRNLNVREYLQRVKANEDYNRQMMAAMLASCTNCTDQPQMGPAPSPAGEPPHVSTFDEWVALGSETPGTGGSTPVTPLWQGGAGLGGAHDDDTRLG